MEASNQIKKFEEFIDTNYKSNLFDAISKGMKHITIDFNKLSLFDPDLADQMLDNPEDTILSLQAAILHFDIPIGLTLKARIINLPESQKIPIWHIRQQYDNFIKVEGIITTSSDILIRPLSYQIMCSQCGNTFSISNIDPFKPKKPDEIVKCSCGKKGKVNVIDTKTCNIRKVYIEEDISELGPRTSARKKLVLLQDDLTDLNLDEKTLPGKKVMINGWLKTMLVDEKMYLFDTYMIANSIEFVDRGWGTIKVNDKEISKIKEIAYSPTLIKDLSSSILPDIHKMWEVKYALLLQLAGSNNVCDKKGNILEHGCIHIVLVGDPGAGKTYLLKRIGRLYPIYKFTTAATSSGRGLIAIAENDKLLGKWVLNPGAIPMCNGGMCGIDELDKMSEEDYGYLNNAMNDLKVYVDKAAKGILDTDVAIFATMNPESRAFVTGVPIHEQVGLPPDLIDRFCIVLPVKTSENEEDQDKILSIQIDKRREQKTIQGIYDDDLLQKYFAYARTINPKIPDRLIEPFKKRFMTFMGNGSEKKISHRIYNIILRLVHASARLHLRDEVNEDDINEVMDLIIYSYKEQGLITGNNIIDFTRIEHIDKTKTDLHQLIKSDLRELMKLNKEVQFKDLKETICQVFSEDEFEDMYNKMKREGEIYEPKSGTVRLL